MKLGLALRELQRSERALAVSDPARRRCNNGSASWLAAARKRRRLSVDRELLAHGAQAATDERLLELAQRCHPETLRQVRWANATLNELAPQTLIS
jgi:hypothetical protein